MIALPLVLATGHDNSSHIVHQSLQICYHISNDPHQIQTVYKRRNQSA